MMAKVFNTYSFMSSIEQGMAFGGVDGMGQRSLTVGQKTMIQVRASVKKLVLSVCSFSLSMLLEFLLFAGRSLRKGNSYKK
jgi:hypothetical protein